MNIIKLLEGKKTYLIALLLGLAVAAEYLGLITGEVAATLYALLGAGGLATLHAAVRRP